MRAPWGESGVIPGSAELDRASPTANPVGRTRGGLIELKRSVVALATGVLLAAIPATASAARSGGAFASLPASIDAISCRASCAGVGTAQPGSLLEVRGRHMGAVRKVVFLGGAGHADNSLATVIAARPTSVDVVVPGSAVSGRLRAINGDGARSRPSRATIAIQRGGASGPLDAKVVGQRVFLDAARQARIDLMAREPLNVTVALVRMADGALVMGWPLGAIVPGVVRTVTWDGTLGGVPQPAGRYEFRVFAAGSEAQAAQAGPPMATGAFDLLDHKFPVRGAHHFGGPEALFGAGRGGHGHQGQDVFAACGTPLVAARGGVVKLNRFHRRAGNYLVIDGEGTDIDYAYMHLRDPSPLVKGARVRTGQVIGHVGQTGRASGCHLHFEIWSAPGWYTGGAPVDPLPALLAWDAYS